MGREELLANVACPCGSGQMFVACHGAAAVDEDGMRATTVAAMKGAGIRPALIYAFERTGLIVTTENRKLISASDLDEWDDAIAEYEEQHPKT